MAIDPEEVKKRRAQRKARQEARRRKMWIRFGIVAGALALGILLAVKLLPSDAAPNDTPAIQPTDAEETASPQKDPDSTVIHLALAGDVNVTDKIVSSGDSNYDYTDVFLDIAPILADADLTAVNFEGNLCGAPYGTDSVSAPQGLAEAMDRAGVDLVQLANSYSINQGISGLVSTINGIRAAGMEPLGVSTDQADFKENKGYLIRTVDGVRIAFVAFTKGMDGMALPPGSEACVNLLYTDYESTYQSVDSEGIASILKAVSQENPDITVAMLHWGSEFKDSISDSQEDIVALLLENGVDAIIGTHPHYLQQMVFDPEAGTFVAYSLGDLLSDGEKSGTQYSVILDLEITKNNRNGKAAITGYSYTPIYAVTDSDGSVRLVRITEAMAAYEDASLGCVSSEAYGDMTYALSRIEARVSGQG